MSATLTRRAFMKASSIVGGGFALGLPSVGLAEGVSLVGSAELNAYVQVRGDGKIIIFSGSPEMGQGIKTSLPMIVAEEMGADWDDVIVKQTPEIDTERYGQQWTGGSFTLYLNWNLMREMGASAADMFLSAAAIGADKPAITRAKARINPMTGPYVSRRYTYSARACGSRGANSGRSIAALCT